jgi:hypothetical protein
MQTIKLNEYDSIQIMEYKGKLRIELGREKGDKWYSKRIKKQEWNEEMKKWEWTDKESNLSIPLGDYEKARTVVAALLVALESMGNKQQDLSDSPF